MKNDDKRIGSCLCGAVEVAVPIRKHDVGVCFCDKCKKWSGGPFMELECGSEVEIQGEENIQAYNSSAWAQRGFCKRCGSHLYLKDLRTGEFGIPPGLFSENAGLELTRQVFSDKKPDYFAFSNDTQNITSAFIYEHYPETRENT